ncbi:hemerythrin domain-containing protein [Amycolatopsis sp. NPDC088138]|uniref:hemerythrin domain-containing protein n=1 Tax=Amycolatopsis sp. NPDC088138 TaxID=3363938 RepID=UPI00382B1CC6
MTNEPLADVRDMYLAHVMFRREIGLAPALIRGVAEGDAERAAVVADHVRLVDTVLHHHHEAEDEHLWHRLLERAGADAEPVVRLMEEQHGAIDKLLGEVRAELTSWRETADPVRGAALAETLTLLHERLVEHLAVEEEQALPLIGKHITAAEWGQMIAASAADVAPEQMPLIFGLMTYEGDPGTVRDVVASMPPEVSSVIGDLAAQAFAAHAERVHGTATPERFGAAR